MEIGTEFVYNVMEMVSDRERIDTFKERYVLKETDGDDYIFDHYIDGKFVEKVPGKKTYANGHIRNDHMMKVDDRTIKTAFGEKTLAHHSTDMCGGGVDILTDGMIAYRWTENQMWSGGVLFRRCHSLIRTSLPLQD